MSAEDRAELTKRIPKNPRFGHDSQSFDYMVLVAADIAREKKQPNFRIVAKGAEA